MTNVNTFNGVAKPWLKLKAARITVNHADNGEFLILWCLTTQDRWEAESRDNEGNDDKWLCHFDLLIGWWLLLLFVVPLPSPWDERQWGLSNPLYRRMQKLCSFHFCVVTIYGACYIWREKDLLSFCFFIHPFLWLVQLIEIELRNPFYQIQ